MRTLAPALLASLALAAPAAAAPRVEVLVVGKSAVLADGKRVPQRAVTVRASGRRCRVGEQTPLAALVRTGLPLRIRDYGSCGRRARDGGGLFVRRIGPDANRGADGWVYKTGRRTGSVGAGDPSARVRAGGRVLWFWCVSGSGGCQRTLAVVPAARSVAPGAALRVTVRGYDDSGRGIAVPGATVRFGDSVATTGDDGTAVLTAPAGAGRHRLVAERPGMVRSFAERVAVG